MKKLIKTLQQDENSNKFYYDKMLKDFELESRYNAMVRSVRNKWHNESLKYIHRVHDMKEKKEENYINRMRKLQKIYDDKDNKIKNKLRENKLMKEEERKHSHDLFSKKEQRARDTYNRKLQMDEEERTENEKKLLNHSK